MPVQRDLFIILAIGAAIEEIASYYVSTELPLYASRESGILFAKEGPILTKYSLNLFVIIFLSIISVLLTLNVSTRGAISFLWSIYFIVCHVCLVLNLNNSNYSAL